MRELALKRTSLQSRLEEFERARAAAQSQHDRTSLIREALTDVETVLDASEDTMTNSEKNQWLAQVVESIYPDLSGERFTITFRGFDADTQLIAEVEQGKTPILSVKGFAHLH